MSRKYSSLFASKDTQKEKTIYHQLCGIVVWQYNIDEVWNRCQINRKRGNVTEGQSLLYQTCKDFTDPPGFMKHFINDAIGYGVFTTQAREKHSFLLEYPGEHINKKDGEKRLNNYDDSIGSFLFFYNDICVDATSVEQLGKYVNDSPYPNSTMKAVNVDGNIHLCLFALDNIPTGVEIRYSYGVSGLPWRKNKLNKTPYTLKRLQEEAVTEEKIVEQLGSISLQKEHEVDFIVKSKSILCTAVNDLAQNSNDTTEPCSLLKNIIKEELSINSIQNETTKPCSIQNNAINEELSISSNQNETTKPCSVERTTNNGKPCITRIPKENHKVSTDKRSTANVKDGICLSKGQKLAILEWKNSFQSCTTIKSIETTEPCSVQNNTINEELGINISENETTKPCSVQKTTNNGKPCNTRNPKEKPLGSISPLYEPSFCSSPTLHGNKTALNCLPDQKSTDLSNECRNSDIETEELQVLPNINQLGLNVHGFHTPKNDSGMELEGDIDVFDTDEETEGQPEPNVAEIRTNKSKDAYKKPIRPCLFCDRHQSRLKRHILAKHKKEARVAPLLTLSTKEQDRVIAQFRREAIKIHNIKCLNGEEKGFLRERKNGNDDELPLICSGCEGFFKKSYKAKHQLVCPANGKNLMLPMVMLQNSKHIEDFSEEFKSLLNTLRLDEVGDCIKNDEIILMIGNRSFNSLKRKQDKKTETTRYVRSRMRLTARVYTAFIVAYKNQSTVTLEDMTENTADLFRRESITILGEAVNEICSKEDMADDITSITKQKSGLKISILNLLKVNAKFIIGYFLMKNDDERAKRVNDFLQVLKLVEDEIFGDALYDINYRRNVQKRKPKSLPKDEDVEKLLQECIKIMSTIDEFDHSFSDQFLTIRAATATFLIIFNARRGGEPVRLTLSQWEEALTGEWTEKIAEEINQHENEEVNGLLVTYQTGKGADHLVPVMFPQEAHKAMKYLVNQEVRLNANISVKNDYIFPSSNQSPNHVNGWHCVNTILSRVGLSGSFNATTNRHRVASLLAQLALTESEKDMIFKHFGHSRKVNENIYQVAAGTLQVNTTGKRLLKLVGNKNIPAETETDETATASKSTAIISSVAATSSKAVEYTIKAASSTNRDVEHIISSSRSAESTKNQHQPSRKYPKRMSAPRRNFQNSLSESSSDENDDSPYIPHVDEGTDGSGEDEIANKTTVAEKCEYKYRRWSQNLKDKFEEVFGEFVKGSVHYPSLKLMEKFAVKNVISVKQVKIRIMNSRKFFKTNRNKMAKEMGIQ